MNEALQESVETEAPVEVQAQEMQEQPQEQSPDRPDWLPEKFERPEELAISYGELERKFYQRKDDLKTEIVSELNEEAMSAAPISPGDYEIKIESPEGLEVTVDENSPMVGWFRDKAHEYGLSQEEFTSLMNEYAVVDATRGPDWNVESEILGEHAEQRLDRVDNFMEQNLSEESYAVFANVPASAGMVQLCEEIMELNGQPKFNMVSETEFQENLTIHDLREMQKDPRYSGSQKERDPAFINKVGAGFAQLAKRK